jgi:hypothetical protein
MKGEIIAAMEVAPKAFPMSTGLNPSVVIHVPIETPQVPQMKNWMKKRREILKRADGFMGREDEGI